MGIFHLTKKPISIFTTLSNGPWCYRFNITIYVIHVYSAELCMVYNDQPQ